MTIRELIIKLVECGDLDREVSMEYDYTLYDLKVEDVYSDFITLKCVIPGDDEE